MNTYTFASATILLILITDPIGNIPVFANALRNVPAHRRTRVILREVTIAFFILLAFMFSGERFLSVMGLSPLSLQVAGAVVLFLIALRMVFPTPHAASAEPENMQEPLIVPLAVPSIAGPSAMATVLLLVSNAPDRRLEWVGALVLTITVSAVVLLLSDKILRIVGMRVVHALERLMGLLLVAVAVEMLIRGVKELAGQM